MRMWLAGLLFAVSLAVPGATYAADAACTCFCGTPSEGAVALEATSPHPQDCIESCRDAGKEVVGCYAREDQYPEHSEICWTQEQCTSGTQTSGSFLGSEWFDDTPHCDDRKEPMGYCYAAPRSISTIIGISGDNTFSGLADYIDTIYRWLVPTMAIVAIVMVMIAGLQYILSRGNPSAVKQAKERIVKAVVGTILLLSAYTLANLLDPRLVEFTQLRIPKVKQVVLLSPGSKCETLAAAGIEIDHVAPASFVDKTCTFETGGTTGVVTDMANVNDEVDIGSWKEGDTCNYSKCQEGASCMSTGCMLCSDVAFHAMTSVNVVDADASVNDPTAVTLYPTPTNCSLMSDTDGGINADKQYCVYTTGGLAPSIIASFPVSCVNVPVECAVLRSMATAWIPAGRDVCGMYGELDQKQTFAPTLTASYVDYTVNDVLVKDFAQVDTNVYKTLCNDDPCGLGAMQAKTCGFTTTDDGGTCDGR